MKRILRPFWLFLAAVFLFEAWLWDRLTEFGHWLRDQIPFERFKRWVAERVERMPPWAALVLFGIPVIVVQPLKLASLYLMTHGHMVLGALGFVLIKIVGFGLVAFLFDLTRDKLMTFRWFVWGYERVLWLRQVAGAFIAPYKAALLRYKAVIGRRLGLIKAAALRALGLGREGRSMLARLRARVRR
jgi:hypothetical protein